MFTISFEVRFHRWDTLVSRNGRRVSPFESNRNREQHKGALGLQTRVGAMRARERHGFPADDLRRRIQFELGAIINQRRVGRDRCLTRLGR